MEVEQMETESTTSNKRFKRDKVTVEQQEHKENEPKMDMDINSQ